MKRDLLQFLFGESQVDDEISGLVESIADIDTDGASRLKVEKAPLAKALKTLDIDGELESDPRGLSLVFSDGDLFRAAHVILNEPDSLAKLAEMGWVYSLVGDVAQAFEPAEWRIRFLELTDVEPANDTPNAEDGNEARLARISKVIKAGREFATKKPEHSDTNPVEFDDKTSDDRHKGMGKEKSGAQPEGKPKGVGESFHDELFQVPEKDLPFVQQLADERGIPLEQAVKDYLEMYAHEPAGSRPIRMRGGSVGRDWREIRRGVGESGEKKYRKVKCNSCEAMAVNGRATHEHGCPNSRKPWVRSDDDEHMVPGEVSHDDDVDESSKTYASCPKCGGHVDLPETDSKAPMHCSHCGHEGRAKMVDRSSLAKSGKLPSKPDVKENYTMACPKCKSKEYYIRGGKRKCSHCDEPVEHGPMENPSRTESLVNSLIEGGHKAGCQCGFCKNKGKGFKRNVKSGNDNPEEDEKDEEQFRKDRSASPEGEAVRQSLGMKGSSDKVEHTFDSLDTPQDIVNNLLQDDQHSNPGTPPGIMGHKSFSTLKVPKDYPDRKFSPAKGMVQPDNAVVNQQAKRKVNDR